MTLRIAFNQSNTIAPKTGVGRYTAELLTALERFGPDLHVTPLPSHAMAAVYRQVLRLFPAKVPNDAPHAGKGKPGFEMRSILRWAKRVTDGCRNLTSRRFDLYHEPNFLALPAEVPTVVTIHDLSPIRMPEFHPAVRIAAFERQLSATLKQAHHIITPTKVVREEVIAALGWPADRVTCTYEGAHASLRPLPDETVRSTLRRRRLPASYLLYVGTLEPRKNLLRLMQAYINLPVSDRDRCPLLLVGKWGWNCGQIADFYESQAKGRGVVHIGYLRDEDLAALYNGARALVYPSLYEGFGLPPLEMMSCGGAVLASTAGAHRELFAGVAELMDPLDIEAWTNAMARVIRDDDWHRQLRTGALARAAQFSWDRCAAATCAVYDRVLNRANSVRRAA
jgi:glycosyltransferase involved in cell wall biosynthesis